jgi:hypothetical protein
MVLTTNVSSFAMSPDGTLIAAYGIPDALHSNFFYTPPGIWRYLPQFVPGNPAPPPATTELLEINSGRVLAVLPNSSWPMFSPDGKTLVVQECYGGTLQVWDIPMQRPIGVIVGYSLLTALLSLVFARLAALLWARRTRARRDYAGQAQQPNLTSHGNSAGTSP